jgi:hypothetical protein
MKSKIISVFLAFFLLFNFILVQGAIGDGLSDETRDAVEDALNENIDQIKEMIVQNLDRKIIVLENFKIKVDDANIDDSDKTLIKGDVDEVIQGLENYKSQIEAASTITDVASARQEANQYIRDNKQKIIDSVKELAQALSDEVLEVLNSIMEKLQENYEELKQACPEASAEFQAIEDKIDELNRDITLLALKVGRGQSVTQEDIDVLAAQISEIALLIQDVAQTCVDIPQV